MRTLFRRQVLLAGPALLMSVTARAASLKEIKKRGTIRIVTTASSPPHGFLDPRTGQLAGVMVEVGEAVANKIGLKPEFSEVPFGGLIGSITSGRSDLMSAPLFITPQRAEVLDFSSPVYGWGEGLLVRADNNRKYSSLESLAGNSVGVLVSSVQYNMIKRVNGIKDVRTYPDYVSLMADLRAGRIDVAVVDPPSIAYQIKTNNVSGLKFADSYKPQKIYEVGLAVAKGNTRLLEAVNIAISDIKADGELEKILDHWGILQTMAK